MNVVCCDGETRKLKFNIDVAQNKSELHLIARSLLKEIYPLDNLIEEVYVPGPDKLYFDFYVPSRHLFIEVQGEQHYKYNSFFYRSKYDFLVAQKRDKLKVEFCTLNNFNLIELRYNETKLWKNQLMNT